MNTRRQLERKIRKSKERIEETRTQLVQMEAYTRGLEEALRMIPKDENGARGDVIRQGSAMDKTRDLLVQAGRPMHITEIVVGIGKENTKPNRVSLSGSIGNYVRRAEVFSRTGPNTFGLLGQDYVEDEEPPEELEEPPGESEELPEDFGGISQKEKVAHE